MPTETKPKRRGASGRPSGTARRTASASAPTKRRTVKRSTGAGTKSRVPAPQRTKAPARRRKKRRQNNLAVEKHFFANGVFGDFRKPLDKPMLLITILLVICGWVALLTASYPAGLASTTDDIGPLFYAKKQAFFIVLGFAAMILLSGFDYHRYNKPIVFGLYTIAIGCLIAVLLIGKTYNNARRWLGPFQPSELAKLAVILLFAYLVSNNQESTRSLRGLVPYIAALGVVAFLLLKEPHGSATAIICLIGAAILFVGGLRYSLVATLVGLGACLGLISYFLLGHVRSRIAVWWDPFQDAGNDGYQAVQSFIAIGSGGLFGRGLGNSRQKYQYLPEPMNDFIFSVVCEELGFIGAAIILVLFAYFIARGYRISLRTADRWGCLLGVGITTHLAFQIVFNLAVVSGAMPVTGVSLPLFSYGGTALVLQLVEIGILLNVSRHIPPSLQGD